MPVVAVIGAIALDAGAIGAAVGGTLTTLSAITAIGATVGAIGAVTGNKTMTMVGGALGIVGAVGTLATGAGVLDNVNSLFTPSSTDVTDAASGASADAAASAAGDAPIDATGAPLADDAPPISPETPTDSVGVPNADSVVPTPTRSINVNPTQDATAGTLSSPGTSSTPAAPSTQAPATAAQTSATTTPPVVNAANAAKLSQGDMTTAQLLAQINSSNNKNLLTMGAIQAGGSLISGLTNPMTPAQIAALNAQADQNNAAAALEQKEAANIGGSLPTASQTNTGFINAKPVSSPLITGVPNVGTTPTTPQVTGVPA